MEKDYYLEDGEIIDWCTVIIILLIIFMIMFTDIFEGLFLY